MSTTSAPREVIVIDGGIADWESLVANLDPAMPIILLPAGGNGLEALALALADYGMLDALHLVSHGSEGQLHLGELRLNSANLGAQAEALAQIAAHLAPDSDVLLYGCYVAQGEGGQSFVNTLASALNGADVAASVDRTGASALDGDWDLEYWEGQIETMQLFNVNDIVEYNATLFVDDSATVNDLSLSIVLADTALNTGETSLTTFTFSEAVTGFTNEDLSVPNGKLSAVSSSDGVTWTATFTPNGNTTDASNEIAVDMTGVSSVSSSAPGIGITSSKNFAIDTTSPTVTSVNSSSVNGAYKAGDTVNVQVNFSEAVTVIGTPQLTLETGVTDQIANYVSGSGTSTLTFDYTVQSGDTSADLDYQSTMALALNGGTIKDAAANAGVLTLATPGAAGSLGANKTIAIDGVAPAIASAAVPADATYRIGQLLNFTVTYNEVVTVNIGSGRPFIDLTLDTGGTVQANYLSGSGTNTLTFRYTVGSGRQDTDGIVAASSITLNGGTLRDAAGNNAATSGIGFASTAGVLVDGIGPTISSINRVGSAATNATSVDYEVTFSETVKGVDKSDFELTKTGTASGAIASVSGAGSNYTVTVNNVTGAGTVRLDTHIYTQISDVAGNKLGSSGTGYRLGQTYTIDSIPPAAPSTLDLASGSDSGISSTDDLTNATTPTFTGTAEADTTVKLYDTDGSTMLGTTTADGNGNWSITSSTLASGVHTLTTKATDAAGNVSAVSAGLLVTVDTLAPLFTSANVNGNTLVLTYTEATTLDATHLPAAGDFAVVAGGTANAVTGVAINAAAKTATLMLTTAVNAGQVVTVAYNDPTGDDDANALQDAAGNDTATLAATAVNNNSPVSDPGPPPPPPSPPVDGIPIVTTPGDGGTAIITIPVVLPTRPDDPDTPNSQLADIPLFSTPDGRPIVQVSVPVGVGLQAQGLPNPVSGDAALTELLLRIERVAGDNPELTNDGQVFLASLDPSEPLTVQTITATAGEGFNPNVPFVISGSTVASDGKQAIILDARALPSGTLVQVDNVDFIAVVGAVRIIGGAGQNIASGDSSAQWIVLGEDDDVIHGGGGSDIVASKAGNDRLYGDDGNDTIVGGVGDDHLEGGAGNDLLQGGMSDAGAWSFALNTDGSLQVSYSAGQPLLTDTHNGSIAGRWSGGDVQDARIALVYQDYTQLETISLLFKGLTGELPTLQAMNTFATQGWSRAELLQAAWTWYEDTLPANATTREKVQALIGQTWGESQATEQNIQTGLDYLAQGGSWSEGLGYLVTHANVRQTITNEGQSQLRLTQNTTLSEAGWGADSGADTLLGGAGNDVLIGGSGNDILDGGQGTDMAVFVGAVQNFSLKLRASTASDAVAGQQEVVLRYNLSGEEDILRSVELVQIGGQAYRLELQGLQPEEAYQGLAGYEQALDIQELRIVGLPSF